MRTTPATSMMSSQSRAPPPPPPPPPPPALLPLLLTAVTVREAEAGAVLPPAGPVIRSLVATVLVYVPAVVLVTLTVRSHDPSAGIMAPLIVTLPALEVTDPFAPAQVAAGA